jgi:phosphatidylglycerophosphate synthase
MAKRASKRSRRAPARKRGRAGGGGETLRWPQDSAYLWLIFALLFIAGAVLTKWNLIFVGLLMVGIVVIASARRHGGGSVPERWLGKEAAQRVAFLIGAVFIAVSLWQLVSWS